MRWPQKYWSLFGTKNFGDEKYWLELHSKVSHAMISGIGMTERQPANRILGDPVTEER